MSEPTQKHKQLAERIYDELGFPDIALDQRHVDELDATNINLIAKFLADAQAEEREVLQGALTSLEWLRGETGCTCDQCKAVSEIIERLTLLLK